MRKITVLFLVALLSVMLFAIPSNAAPDPMAVAFQEQLGLLDWDYKYNFEYMISEVTSRLIPDDFWERELPYVTSPASEFEALLHDLFVLSNEDIEDLRTYGNTHYSQDYYDSYKDIHVKYDFYDASTNTYNYGYYRGFGGGDPPARKYVGYIKNGDAYDVYFEKLNYQWLDDVYEEGDVYEYIESLDYPETIEYKGLVYNIWMGDYYTVLSHDGTGRKYTVEMNGDIVRIISCTDFAVGELPEAFDDKNVTVIYDIPTDLGITLPENDCFEADTVVKVEKVQSGSIYDTVVTSMSKVADQYSAFEFTATKNNVSVQPSGKLTVTFDLPEGYSLNVAVYYMAPDGTLTKLLSTVNAGENTVTVELEHFSTYILADEDTKPHVHSYSTKVTPSTCTEAGYTTYTCTCGDTYEDNKTEPLGHSFQEWTQIKAPSVDEEGTEKRECSACSEIETRSIDKLMPEPTPEGTQGGDIPVKTPENDKQEDGGNKTVLIVVVAVVVVAAVVTAVVLTVTKKKK